jgi:formate/nitrite transporter
MDCCLPAAAAPKAVSAIAAPADVYAVTLDAAEHKAATPAWRAAVLGVMAGSYVGIGVTVNSLVGGGLSPALRHAQPGLFSFLYGVFGFPTALTLIVATGADLFTSTVCYAALGAWERRVRPARALAMCAACFLANLAGCLLALGLMTGARVFAGRDEFLREIGAKKVAHAWAVCFAKGVLCNWYVNLAVWMANAARDLGGKFVGILLPISAFVVANGEHCVANMFLIPASMVQGSGVGVGDFLARNLVPTTLGNVVGGLMTAAFFALAFSSRALHG